MNRCIGCKCCVVACNEQNGNPAEINWRRVGEIEGGWYPEAWRLHLSMSCNHCLEPSCMHGCPVEAYQKDAHTGLVLHDPQICIGCQYCTWNCSYGVPQFNAERGVVGKCDMCHGRLAEGREPACVAACPEAAIQVEIVNQAQWRREFRENANAPGLPSADDSLSTTRLTLPRQMPSEMRAAHLDRLRPEAPHWPLVFMTVLTQLSVVAFALIWVAQMLRAPEPLAAAAALGLGMLALAASTAHLGRPIYAYRALKMWRRSWLSREVLLFSVFCGLAASYAMLLWTRQGVSGIAGLLTSVAGLAGILASAKIYLVPARPAWNTGMTVLDFYLSGAVLGPFLPALLGHSLAHFCLPVIAGGAVLQLMNQGAKLLRLLASKEFELQASGRMLAARFTPALAVRCLLLVAGGLLIPLLCHNRLALAAGLLLAFAGEVLGRWLFFVTVVPKNMAACFLGVEQEAA